MDSKGIVGNEEADKLAKEATEESSSEEIKIPSNDLREEYKRTAFEDTTKEIKLQAEIKGRFYFQHFYKEEEKSPWFENLNFPRRAVVLYNRLRAYHYNLNASLARKSYIDTARYQCGREYEDINHFVFECAAYDEIRQGYNLNGQLDKVGASKPDDVWSWLRKEELTALRVIYEFIRLTGRII